MKTIVWVSRHAMTDEQANGLAETLGVDAIRVEQINPTWFATSDEEEDIRRNCQSWRMLVDRASTGEVGEQPVIAGVFPPVALEALPKTDFSWYTTPRILTPVSRQAPELRASPDAAVPFVHVRWAQLDSMA